MNPTKTNDEVRAEVRKQYGAVAKDSTACVPGCCGASPSASLALGYSAEELSAVPEGANLGLGCGNPQAIANLREGERVLDLGSGAGFDAFLAAKRVGSKGQVIGVDMTAEMIAKARKNAAAVGTTNVEFRLGEIEHLPVESNTIDAILSNCVLNLSPDKPRVFGEAFRVLAPGGRLAISDVISLKALPAELREKAELYAGCVVGAAEVGEIERWLAEAGFTNIAVTPKPESREFIRNWFPGTGAEEYVGSATIEATKPSGSTSGPASKQSCCAPSCCVKEA